MAMFYLADLGSVGIVKDRPIHALPPSVWSDGQNVRFREGQAENAAGYDDLVDLSSYFDTLYWSSYAFADEEAYWTFLGELSGTDKAYRMTLEGTVRDITPGAGTFVLAEGNQFTGGNFDGATITCNGRSSEAFYSLPGTWTLTRLPYDDSTDLVTNLKFDVIRPMWQHLFGLGVEVVPASVDGVSQGYYPRLLWFSDSADPGNVPGSWDADNAATLSRSYPDPFASFSGALIDMVQLGQSAIIYQEDACHLCQYTGRAPYVISLRTAFHEIGALASNCVATLRNQHIVLTESDVVVHNAQTAQSILEGRLRRWLFSNMDATNYRNSFVVPNYQGNEIWICFPETDQTYPNLAIVWNFKEDTVSVRDLALGTTMGAIGKQTAGTGGRAYSPAVHTLVTTTDSGKAYRMEFGQDYDGASPVCQLIRTGIPIGGDSQHFKLVREIWPEIQGDGAISVYLGSHERVDDPVNWSSAYSFTPGTDHFIPAIKKGRLHAIKLEWNNCATIRVNRIGFDWEPTGEF